MDALEQARAQLVLDEDEDDMDEEEDTDTQQSTISPVSSNPSSSMGPVNSSIQVSSSGNLFPACHL